MPRPVLFFASQINIGLLDNFHLLHNVRGLLRGEVVLKIVGNIVWLLEATLVEQIAPVRVWHLYVFDFLTDLVLDEYLNLLSQV